MERITGAKFICEVPAGTQLAYVESIGVLATHPNHPPKLIRPDGTIEELKPALPRNERFAADEDGSLIYEPVSAPSDQG
jgi:hypothetical protein